MLLAQKKGVAVAPGRTISHAPVLDQGSGLVARTNLISTHQLKQCPGIRLFKKSESHVQLSDIDQNG
jgi:hypothetical protein